MANRQQAQQVEDGVDREVPNRELQQTNIGFRSIQLLKDQILGIGSYGSVCKAICDDLLCAAKILHPTLFDPTAQQQIARHREHRLPIQRFLQECEFMNAIRHPNIVQHLGTCQDPETRLPVLLMELMDDSLTHFLESSQDPVPYYIQVNLCHDITIAISYLHFNSITHRDLSSNNVLLYGNVRAKVTDFGMAKLGDVNPQATRLTFTICPGAEVYMPPETISNQTAYTAKIDCFAIGTLIIQILTRKFPKPGVRHKMVNTIDPQFPTLEVRVSEVERRQNHISEVDPNHPLLPIALDCLNDSDFERPSAQELCHRVAALKETPQYTDSAQERRPQQDEREDQITELQQQIQEKDDDIQQMNVENHQLRRQHAQQIQGLQQIIESQNNRLQEKDREIRDKDQVIEENTHTIEAKERQLRQVTQQLETSEQVMDHFQTRIHEIVEQHLNTDSEVTAKPQPSLGDTPQTHHSDTSSRVVTRDSIQLRWREGKKAPCKMSRGPDAVVDGITVYLRAGGTKRIYGYNATENKWNTLPNCTTGQCSLAVVNNLLTTIGGISGGKYTNQLFSLTGKGISRRWKEVFQPMPTERDQTVAVCSGQALIVAGGVDQDGKKLRTVEVMDNATQQWSTVADLPGPLYGASVTICGDRIYTLGGWSDVVTPTKSVYTCTLKNIFQSCQSKSLGARLAQSLSLTAQASPTAVWEEVADLPVSLSTCVTLHGRLLAIGGCDDDLTHTSDIRIYHPSSNTWEVMSKMTTCRDTCFAAVLPNNQLIVVGGNTTRFSVNGSDSVEIASVV